MSVLDGIGVQVEATSVPAEMGNVQPVLHEIRHALELLQSSGEKTVIDLRAIPFGPGDKAQLLAELGTGEVSARIDALGPTHIRETALPGVWLVEYRAPDDSELALHIEVARVPGLLSTPTGEITIALEHLKERLNSSSPAPGGTEE
jgi:hydrogenase-1 operon protein HyaF